jgi:glyoxylase-like metal-dependent hydrolase (beta-lactamase superfamily II)
MSAPAAVPRLPPSIRVLERGWLSSNNVVFLEGERASLVDSGYVSHAEQTVSLLRQTLAGRRLARLINTHSHSDHIGGNAAVAAAFGCRIAIPQGIVPAVVEWDEAALLLRSADQSAARFAHDEEIAAGDEIELGGMTWQALAAPGHDMHALVFHCPQKRILLSGDALWRSGFGVVFAEVMGTAEGLRATRGTLEMISRLPIDTVIPGHGPPFAEVGDALEQAFARLAAFEADGERLARHALKVVLSFALLEKRRMALGDLPAYLAGLSLYRDVNARYFRQSFDVIAGWLVRDLERAGAARREGDLLVAGSAV